MTSTALDRLIDCQAALILALDDRDADAIFAASQALAKTMANLSASVVFADPERAALGMELAEAVRARVKYLTALHRQKIDQLGQYSVENHAKPRKYG